MIPGKPQGKARHRVRVAGSCAQLYQPRAGSTAQWERKAAQIMGWAWKAQAPLSGPVSVSVVAVHPRPQRLRKSQPGRVWCVVRPDLDNVIKCCLDALQNARVISDDKIVVRIQAEQFWAAEDEEPHTEINVCDIETTTTREENEQMDSGTVGSR